MQSADRSFSVCISARELFSPSQKYQLLVYHADSLFHDKEYRNAVSKYTMALQQKKALSKTSKVRPSTGNAASTPQSQVFKNWLMCRIKWSCSLLKLMLLTQYSQNHLGWKRCLRSLSPTINLTLPSPPLNHVPKHHVDMPFKYLREWIYHVR